MFEKDEEITAAIDAVYTLASKLNRGQVLAHEAIHGVLGVDRHSPRWGHVMRKVRRRLLKERGIATLPERGFGYKLLGIKETFEKIPIYRHKKARSQFRREIQEIEGLPSANLTDHQKLQQAFRVQHAKQLRSAISKDMKTESVIFRPTEATPRRPSP